MVNDSWPTVGRLSSDCWPTVGRLLADSFLGELFFIFSAFFLNCLIFTMVLTDLGQRLKENCVLLSV